MFSSHIIRLAALCAIVAAIVSGCRRQPGADETGERPAFDPPPSRIPFATLEPDVFQVEVVMTSGPVVRSSFLARSGSKKRFEFDRDKRSRIVVILADQQIVILPELKKYSVPDGAAPFSTDDWSSFLTTNWLNSRIDSTFEKIDPLAGAERYRVRFGENGSSEAVVTIDPVSGMATRQEFFSVADGVATSVMTIELRNFKPEAGDDLFTLPPGYEKVELNALLKLKTELEIE